MSIEKPKNLQNHTLDTHYAIMVLDLRQNDDSMLTMSNRKKKPDEKADRHKFPGLLLRLPPKYREMLEQCRRKHRRTLTEQAKIAFEEMYRADGFDPDAMSEP